MQNEKHSKSFSITLSSRDPIRQTALIEGHHLLNSAIQLAKVDFGTITKCGPPASRNTFKYPTSDIV